MSECKDRTSQVQLWACRLVSAIRADGLVAITASDKPVVVAVSPSEGEPSASTYSVEPLQDSVRVRFQPALAAWFCFAHA